MVGDVDRESDGGVGKLQGTTVLKSMLYFSFFMRSDGVRLFHVFLIFELFLLGSGVLVLLVLRNKVVHVRLGLSELHLVHALSGVPVEERLTTEHRGELLGNALEHVLDGGGITDEGGSHLESLGRDVADGGLDVVRDPLDEVRGVLVLHVEHLLVNLLGRHAAAEHRRSGEVSAVSGVRGTHHVLGVEHLLGELGDGEGPVLLGASGGEWGESSHEEVETGERDQVHGELSEVRVELTRESEAARDTRNGSRDEVVEVSVGGGGQLQGSEADVVQGLVVNHHDLIGVLDELVDGEGGVVRLDDGVGHFRGGEHGEGAHHPVGVLLADLGDEQGAHSRAGAATEGVGDLEALEAVAALSLFSDNVEDGVDELSTLGVVTLGPVVTSTSLTEDEVVGSEELTEGTSTDGVHGAGLEVHKDGTGDVTATGGFVVVDVDSLELEVGVTVVGAGGVNTVFVGDDFPELSTDLVTALAGLDVDDFSHLKSFVWV